MAVVLVVVLQHMAAEVVMVAVTEGVATAIQVDLGASHPGGRCFLPASIGAA